MQCQQEQKKRYGPFIICSMKCNASRFVYLFGDIPFVRKHFLTFSIFYYNDVGESKQYRKLLVSRTEGNNV